MSDQSIPPAKPREPTFLQQAREWEKIQNNSPSGGVYTHDGDSWTRSDSSPKAAVPVDTAIPQHIETRITVTPQGVRVRIFFRWHGHILFVDRDCGFGDLSLVPGQRDGPPPAPGGDADPDARPDQHAHGDVHAQLDSDAYAIPDTNAHTQPDAD
jgi:hypothetical protein